jgi:diamine N-acetyltransferase
MGITIRLASTNDAELIADISRQTFFETFAAQNTKEDMDKFMQEQFTKEQLMQQVGQEGNIFLLAFDNDEPVGYVRLIDEKESDYFPGMASIEIARIYAIQSAIGKGVGKLLMEKCISIAKEKNKAVIWLGVWEKNEKAIHFYTKFGFEKFGVHDFILGNDAQQDWLMKKYL